jgi:hypothetical protein
MICRLKTKKPVRLSRSRGLDRCQHTVGWREARRDNGLGSAALVRLRSRGTSALCPAQPVPGRITGPVGLRTPNELAPDPFGGRPFLSPTSDRSADRTAGRGRLREQTYPFVGPYIFSNRSKKER